MKFKTTQKAIRESYPYIIRVGYCNLGYLLSTRNPIAYTTRVEGWASDVYGCEDVETPNGYYSVAISTGCQPFGKIKPPYELQRKYDTLARDIHEATYFEHEKRKEQLDKLLGQFIAEVLEGETVQ